MLMGRLLGWVLIGLAVIMASADAVLALGPADTMGIMTADVVTLLVGETFANPGTGGLWRQVERALLGLPAWIAMLSLGLATVLACRRRPRRFRFRP